MSDIRNLVNQMVSRYMGNSVQSPLTLPAVNDLSVGADEYARKHKPATGQLGLFEKPEERQKPLFSKKVDDEAGRWVTMRGARVYISSDDGRVLKGPKRLMGKTKEQIERESASAGNGEGAEKPPMPKGLAEMGRIRGGRKDNRQKGLFEEINPGFKWDEDEDVKSVSPKPSAVQLTRDEWDQKVRDEIRSIMGDADYENTDIDRRDGVDAIDDAFGFAHDNNRNYGDKIWALNDKWIDSMPEKEIKRSPAGKSEEADGEPFALSGAPSKSPVTPTDFGKADGATKQGALFDSGKGKGKDGKGDLPGQELLFNSDAGDVGNPRTMENRVQVAPRGPYEWKENKSGKKAWFKGETQITGAFVDDSWADEAARQLPADADSKPAPESDFKDHPEFERLQSVYGNLSNDEIKNKIDKMTGEIASLQKAGRREFNMNGGRRTSAAVSNEGARNVGQEKLLLGAYLKHREKNGVKDAALPAVNNTKTMKNRVQKKSKKSEPWQMSRSEYADSQRLSEPSPKEIEDKKKELELQVSTMRLSPDQAESTLKAFMNRHKGDDSISNFYHKKFVEKAIEKGQPVPAEVLADYPDLAGKTKQDDSGPQDGDRDATGLVFRDGRWHRDEEEGQPEAKEKTDPLDKFRDPRDKSFEKLISLKSAKNMGDGIYYFDDSAMTAQRRNSLKTESEKQRLTGRIDSTKLFEFKTWAEVTGDFGAKGYAILDRRQRVLDRELRTEKTAEQKPESPSPSPAVNPHDSLLEQAAKFRKYGQDYNRNIATSANRLEEARSKGHGESMLNHLADELKLRLDSLKQDDGPQDGDRDATGLVFRDGRWHRDDEGEVEGEKQEAPSNSPAVNPFREKMDSLNRKADSLTPGGSSFDKQMASAFPLGVGRSGNASSRKTSKQAARRIDQSVNNALKSIEVRKKANALKGQAEAFDRGEIDEHGNRTELGRSKDAEQLAKSQEKKQAVASFWDDHSDWLKSTLQKGRKMAIAENPSNTVTVARINKTGITTDSGSKWMYRDLIPLGDDGKAMSPKDVISKVKEWKEKKQNPDKYSRHQLVAFANSLTDKYVRGEAGVVQIPVDKYAHPLVHAAVGGLGHMAVQSLVKNKTLRKLAHAAVASAMAAWMASANAGQAGQGQGPSSSPAVNQPAVSAPASPFARQQSGNRSIDAIVNQAFQNHQQAVAEAKAEKGIPADPGQAVPHSVSNTTGARAPGVKPLKGEDEPKSANPSTLPAGNGKSGDTAGKSEGFTDSEHPRHPAGAPESKGGEFAPKDGVESGSESPRNYPDNLNKPADQQTNYSPPERTIESLTGGGNDGDSPATDEPKSLEQKIAEHRMKLASQKSEPGPKASRRDNPDTSWKKAMNFGTERVQASKNAKSQERKARKQQEQQAKQQEQAVSFNPDQLEKESEASLVDGGAESDSPYDSKPNPEDFKREKDYQRALKAWKREKGAQRASITKKIAKSVVPEIAMEYELDHSELESAVNDAIAMESEGHKRQEEARRYVTDRGYNAGRINRNEDAGKDHSSTSLDEFASEWAGLYPEIAGSDESQWVDRMWNLAKAGKQDAPSAGDENFVRKVAERLHESRGQNSSPFPDDSESGSFAPIHGQIGDVDFTPFSRRSLVDSLNLIVDRYLRETIDNRYHVT